MNGPLRTFTATTNAAVLLSHCGHSCILQHYVGLNVGVRTKTTWAEPESVAFEEAK